MRILPILAIAAALVGCTSTNNTTATNTTTTPKLSNSDLEQAIKNQLASDQRTQNDKINVSADADKNQVTLSGTVYSETARTDAINAAKAARPGIDVVDKIEVKPGEMPKSAYNADLAQQERTLALRSGDKIGPAQDDAWIHSNLSAKLAGKSAPGHKMNIDVVNGVVTLRGTAESAQAKQEAGRMAMGTDGVKRVNNLLKASVG
ncbi:MAG: BON domain-containing protein [Bryobacterales bacterium]|nr:BON domain-containing protein [Bryobacterales bacterium]MBV9398735.1 BON domain-containing protein [Bryobacterales bacterium]